MSLPWFSRMGIETDEARLAAIGEALKNATKAEWEFEKRVNTNCYTSSPGCSLKGSNRNSAPAKLMIPIPLTICSEIFPVINSIMVSIKIIIDTMGDTITLL